MHQTVKARQKASLLFKDQEGGYKGLFKVHMLKQSIIKEEIVLFSSEFPCFSGGHSSLDSGSVEDFFFLKNNQR